MPIRCQRFYSSTPSRNNVCMLFQYEYNLKVTGDDQANALLKNLIEAGVNIVRFDLSELSLHEIFVREVGEESRG